MANKLILLVDESVQYLSFTNSFEKKKIGEKLGGDVGVIIDWF